MSNERPYSNRELKITAAMYAGRGVAAYVRKHGKLPKDIPMGGASIQLHHLFEERGTDFDLTPDEQLIYDAILREGKLPGGGVRLVKE